jgi:tetratricopeptide (TPR) repeat protein
LLKAINIHETEATPKFRLAETLVVFGDLYAQMGDSHNASACYERALTIYEDLYGADNRKTAETVQNLRAWQKHQPR